MKRALHFATKPNYMDIQFYYYYYFFLGGGGTLLWSVHLCSQNSFSRDNDDLRSLIEKHVVVFVKGNLPQKSSKSLSELKLPPPPPK